jgi:hypothetical protein
VFFPAEGRETGPAIFGAALVGALIVGGVYFPMALLTVAVSDNFLALSPHIVVPSMLRVFLPCRRRASAPGLARGSEVRIRTRV